MRDKIKRIFNYLSLTPHTIISAAKLALPQLAVDLAGLAEGHATGLAEDGIARVERHVLLQVLQLHGKDVAAHGLAEGLACLAGAGEADALSVCVRVRVCVC